MDPKYLPPPEVIRHVARARNDERVLKKALAIGGGIIHWGMNPQTLVYEGAEWIYSIFGLEEFVLHDFLEYYATIRGKSYRINPGSSVIRFNDDVNAIAPSGCQSQIQQSIDILGRPKGISYISPDDITLMLKKFTRWIEGDPVFNGKRISETFRAIKEVRDAPDNFIIKAIGDKSIHYVRSIDMEVRSENSKGICAGCGSEVYCCDEINDQLICRACAREFNGDDDDDCTHWECGYMECDHYIGDNHWIQGEEFDVTPTF